MLRLRDYASTLEWHLAYNETDPVRAIAGKVLANLVMDALEPIVEGDPDAPLLNVQFGTYADFTSFFGLARLHKTDVRFFHIVDYASSMAFELVTNATDPKPDDISVRFFFSDGVAGENELEPFPLFATSKLLLPWKEFASSMQSISIQSANHWHDLCEVPSGSSNERLINAPRKPSKIGMFISKPIAGLLGAMSALATVSALTTAVMLMGGFKLVRKANWDKLREEAAGQEVTEREE